MVFVASRPKRRGKALDAGKAIIGDVPRRGIKQIQPC
jgi:hypothetical protein